MLSSDREHRPFSCARQAEARVAYLLAHSSSVRHDEQAPPRHIGFSASGQSPSRTHSTQRPVSRLQVGRFEYESRHPLTLVSEQGRHRPAMQIGLSAGQSGPTPHSTHNPSGAHTGLSAFRARHVAESEHGGSASDAVSSGGRASGTTLVASTPGTSKGVSVDRAGVWSVLGDFSGLTSAGTEPSAADASGPAS